MESFESSPTTVFYSENPTDIERFLSLRQKDSQGNFAARKFNRYLFHKGIFIKNKSEDIVGGIMYSPKEELGGKIISGLLSTAGINEFGKCRDYYVGSLYIDPKHRGVINLSKLLSSLTQKLSTEGSFTLFGITKTTRLKDAYVQLGATAEYVPLYRFWVIKYSG